MLLSSGTRARHNPREISRVTSGDQTHLNGIGCIPHQQDDDGRDDQHHGQYWDANVCAESGICDVQINVRTASQTR